MPSVAWASSCYSPFPFVALAEMGLREFRDG
jgi:hypothetical protein